MTLSQRHVYLILQEALREGKDQQLLAQAERMRKEGFGWRYDGLADWSTESIFARLRELGVDTDESRFREQAREAGRCKHLEERWYQGPDWGDSPWDDFPFLAAEELWRRLTPDLVCPEFIADELGQVMSATQDPPRTTVELERADIEAAMQAIGYLERFPPAERPRRFEELLECTTYDLGAWLLEFILDYGEAHQDEVTRVADVMSDADPENAANFQGDLALALAWAGRSEAALQRVHANLGRFPRDPWIRVKAGDVYEALDRDEEALELYVEAMRTAETDFEWDGAAERLPVLLRKLGRPGEYQRIAQRHPRPSERSPAAWEPESMVASDSREPTNLSLFQSASDRKVGRNDPCPCGSGKKYKKCCLGRD
jgi:hypothetical protein